MQLQRMDRKKCGPRLVLVTAGDYVKLSWAGLKNVKSKSFPVRRTILFFRVKGCCFCMSQLQLTTRGIIACRSAFGCSAQRKFPQKCGFANTPVATNLCCKRRLCESQSCQLHLGKVLVAVVLLLHQHGPFTAPVWWTRQGAPGISRNERRANYQLTWSRVPNSYISC